MSYTFSPKTARMRRTTSLLKSRYRKAITLTLLLVCVFSPRVHSIPRGPLTLKSQNFDEILTFLGKFLRGRVLVVRNRVRFCQKLKRSQNYDFLTFGLRAASTSSGLDIGVETGLAFTLSAFSFASSKISRIISAAASKVSRLSVSVGSNISAS